RQHQRNTSVPPSSEHAELRPVLDRTLGVVIFQEQAMQVAMIAAGFTADEADALRRSMAAWHRHGSLDHFKERLLSGMRQRGYSQDFAHQLYQQLEGFGSYGFPESHAASFARLAWCSAWFKCHHPEIYLTALLNAQPMGFYSPSQLIQDAQRHGVIVKPISILHSHWESHVESLNNKGQCQVQLGFNRSKDLSSKAARQIIALRQQQQLTSIDALRQQTELSTKELKLLAQAGVLQPLQHTRRQALWQASQPPSRDLLRLAPLAEPTPSLKPMPEALKTLTDYQATGFTLGTHPLAFLRKKLTRNRFVAANCLHANYIDWQPARACGLVTIRQRPMTAKGTVFLTLEDETGNINVIVPAAVAQKQQKTLTEATLIGIYGVWLSQDNVRQLKANRLVDLSHWLGSLPTRSRDFH